MATDTETRVRPSTSLPTLEPVAATARIETLDILRGFAVLGILAVNAIAFAWPIMTEAGSNTAPFDIGGGNQWATWATAVFLHNKCRTLFSMLFGVSIFLVGGERGADPARETMLRRRLLVLGAFGLLHGLALWFGDILLLYAWAGVFTMWARSWSPRRLMSVGLILVVTFSLIEIATKVTGLFQPFDPAAWAKAASDGRAEILTVVDHVRSGWPAAMLENAKAWGLVQGMSLTIFVLPTAGLMMIGLSLFKSGYLAGRGHDRRYGALLMAGLAITAAFGVVEWIIDTPGPAPAWARAVAAVLDALAPIVTLAWVGLLILMTRHGWGFLTRRLVPVGRMAFTNYLSQTLIMTTIFYMPWGPHLYGRVEPAPLFGIVVCVWMLQLIWSPLWLSRFEMGPLEWVWRCLTYGRRVRFLKRA